MLANEGGTVGVWADNRAVQQGWQFQFGAYHLDTDLKWVDQSTRVGNDKAGAYWQAGMGRSRYSFGFGMDAEQILSARQISRIQLSTRGFYRFSRHTQGHGNLLVSRLGTQSGEVQGSVDMGAGLSHRYRLGTSIFAVGYGQALGSGDTENFKLSWDHDPGRRILTVDSKFGARYEYSSAMGQSRRKNHVNSRLSKSFQDISVSAQLELGQERSTYSSSETYSLSGTFNWFINRYFLMNFNLVWNNNQIQLAQTDNATQSKSMLLSLKYNRDWGQRKAVYGSKGSCNGFGIVKGRVFADENRNSLQEAGEKGIANIPVSLDGVYTVRTDANGDYEFSPVSCGRHALSLDIAHIPLPWGLQDEEPVWLHVGTRRSHQMDFALVDVSWVDLNE